MIQTIRTLLANKHTSSSGVIYIATPFLGHIAKVWFPHHVEQIDSTVKAVKEACFAYGMIMAGDAKQGLSKQEAETSFLKKDEVKPEAKL